MAKYTVHFSCGHDEEKELFGKGSERERKIKYWEQCGVCSECYKEMRRIEMEVTHDVKKMSYRDYKRDYPNNRTVPGSWNPEDKTIEVYVKKPADENTSDPSGKVCKE